MSKAKKAVEVDSGKASPSAGVSNRGEKYGRIPRAAGQKVEKTIPNSVPDAGPTDSGKNNRHGYTAQLQDPRRSKPVPPPKSTSRQIENQIVEDAAKHRKSLIWGKLSPEKNTDEDFK
jgi:hypothetical protein